MTALRTFAVLAALSVLWGCASSEVTAVRGYAANEVVARPGRIIVHDFAATPADVPADAAVAGLYEERASPQTAEQIELGRELGKRVAATLVEEILAMGMPAERAGVPPPREGDLVIMGGFVSIDEGSRARRMLIGFGAGAAELKTLVEVYQSGAAGLRPLGEGEVEAGGGRMPGMLVPVAGGAAAGSAVVSAGASGALNIGQEAGPESIEGAAERTAQEISEVLAEAFEKRGWI